MAKSFDLEATCNDCVARGYFVSLYRTKNPAGYWQCTLRPYGWDGDAIGEWGRTAQEALAKARKRIGKSEPEVEGELPLLNGASP